MTQINFTSIIDTALLKANNRDNLKSYLIRQSKIANRDAFYGLEDFSKELIKVATGKIGYIKHAHDGHLKHVQTQIDNIETLSFKDPSRLKDLADYTNEDRAQFQETQRAEYLKWAKHELKNSKLNDYNKNEYGRLETIIDIVNEINNLDKPKLQMNLSKLDNMLNLKYQKHLPDFKRDLKNYVPGYDKMHIDALALLIYESDVLHKNINDNDLKNFKIWQKLFCNILGVEVSQYKPVSIKESEEYKEQVKNTYYYFNL